MSQAGLAHVAAVSFLAARAAPSAGFWIALAGGVALARAGERLGGRRGYGASLAAMLQSVAMIGPARLSVPLTQAISAPLLGRLAARGTALTGQVLACAVIRLLHNAAATAFFIWVIVGGLDAYAGSYDAILERVPLLPAGSGAALAVTGVTILVWSVSASTVQVLVYRRGLRRWADPAAEPAGAPGSAAPSPPEPSTRFDPRAVALAAVIAFGLLLASTSWLVLAAVSAWLVGASLAGARADRDVVPAGVVLAALLAVSALTFGLVAGIGLDLALRRAARAGLLVLVATWLRAAAGSSGLREVSRRGLRRLRAIPSMREAAHVLDELGSTPRLAAAGRSLVDALGGVRKRPLPLVDAVLGWVQGESERFRSAAPGAPARIATRPRDGALVALAAAPALALVGAAM